MWIQQWLLGVFGFCGGLAAACGIFALIIALGVVSDLADQTHTAKHILLYEDAVAAGGIVGNLFSMYRPSLAIGNLLSDFFGVQMAGAPEQWLMGIFGIFAGIFVGAWAMALTEILNVVPIFSRRIHLQKGLEVVVVSMAIGRSIGAILFYIWRL